VGGGGGWGGPQAPLRFTVLAPAAASAQERDSRRARRVSEKSVCIMYAARF
jgi:hypothetical protein